MSRETTGLGGGPVRVAKNSLEMNPPRRDRALVPAASWGPSGRFHISGLLPVPRHRGPASARVIMELVQLQRSCARLGDDRVMGSG